MLNKIIIFFNCPLIVIIGGLTTLFLIVSVLYSIYLVLRGVLPVWVRLGKGLSKREIAIFADDQYDNLEALLADSKLFLPKNIKHFTKETIKSAKDISLILVHWNSFSEKLDEILEIKDASDALIVYAPRHEKEISQKDMEKINNQPNALLVNFRGRLLNDILVSMITTGYKKG